MEEALAWYTGGAAEKGTGPHYVAGPLGDIVQLRPIAGVAWHAGVNVVERRDFLSGHWEDDHNRIPPSVVRAWKDRWPGYQSPQHLYPSKRPNMDYVGVEMVPSGTFVRGGRWAHRWGSDMGGPWRFSMEQVLSVAKLCASIGAQLELPDGWHRGPRLLGHEDVNPYRRPGWDPGAMYGRWQWTVFRPMVGLMIQWSEQ